MDVVYAEQHIHDTVFVGFQTHSFDSTQQNRKTCIPDKSIDRSPAVALNPTQYDMQPSVIVSGLQWVQTDALSRFAFESGAWTGSESGVIDSCSDRPCNGHNMVIIHDLDGSISNQNGKTGQLLYNNPDYVAPYPICYDVSDLSPGVFFCPHDADPSKELMQYSAVWRDWGPQVIQPIITTRHFTGESINRTFASYGPIDDMCAKRMYFSRFPLLIANGTTQSIRSTGTLPSEFLLRWDAPSESSVAVLKIFYQQSYDVTVLVSDDPENGFQAVTRFKDRYPTMDDPAGSNTRDPQQRLLIVTIRGGAKRFYRFRQTPVVAVTMRLDMPFNQFVGETFIANMALLLGITRSRIKIVDVRPGSAIVDSQLTSNITVAQNKSEVRKQVDQLNDLTNQLQQVIASGGVEQALNVSVLECTSLTRLPDILQEDFSKIDYPANATINATEIRQKTIAAFIGVPIFLFTYPTSHPTGQPSHTPSEQPSKQPFSHPTLQPASYPTSHPTCQPLQNPSEQPTNQPAILPSLQPTANPTEQPTKQPVDNPSSQPSSKPSHYPTLQPLEQPTLQPASYPTVQPSLQPFSSPTRQPSLLPSIHPSQQPVGKPTNQPSVDPSIQPSSQPTHPTSQPTEQPTRKPTNSPTSQPSKYPTTQPSSQPSKHPTSQPSLQPWDHPSSQPVKYPSSQPTIKPTEQPSTQPSRIPSSQPTSQPRLTPTELPSTQPFSKPSVLPSAQPIIHPTDIPSSQPIERPTIIPSSQPSPQPSSTPKRSPSSQPDSKPSQSPSEQPTVQPIDMPTSQPIERPTIIPSSQPSSQPLSSPTGIPSAQPDSKPSRYPSRQPNYKPSTIPSARPIQRPTFQPVSRPTGQPSSMPTPNGISSTQPTSQPFSHPSNKPFDAPSMKPLIPPSRQPFSNPSSQPSSHPSSPTSQPISSPSRKPFVFPTNQPTVQPKGKPSQQPICHPTGQPAHSPSSVPSDKPSYVLTTSPTIFVPKTFVSFNLSIGMNGVSKSDVESNETISDHITSSVEIPVNGETPTATISSITEKSQSSRRQLSSSSSILITFDMIFTMSADTTNDQSNGIYDSFVTTMKYLVANGNVTHRLKASGLSIFSNISISASSLQFTAPQIYSNVIRSSSPSVKPTAYSGTLPPVSFNSNNVNTSLGLIIGLSVGLGSLLIFGLYCFYNHHHSKYKRKNVILYPLRIVPSDATNSHNIEDDTYKDLELIKTPPNDLRRRSTKANKGNNNQFDFTNQQDIDNDDIIPPARQIPELLEHCHSDKKLFEHVETDDNEKTNADDNLRLEDFGNR